MNNYSINDWAMSSLGEVAEIKTGKLDSNCAQEGGKYPFFTCAPNPLRINDYSFDNEAILLAGNNADGIFHLNYYNGKFDAYQRTYVITAKNHDALDLRYLFYYLQLSLNLMQNYSQGTATKFLTMKILCDLDVALPPVGIQKKISKALSDIDNKIKNNQRMNEILEAVGGAVFKHWFVDFDFPNQEGKPYKSSGGKMVESDLGPIPIDWEAIELKEIADIANKAINPQEFSSRLFYHYSIPAYDEKESPVLNKGAEIKSIKYLIDNESVLLSKLNPEIPRIWLPFMKMTDGKAICSTEFIVYKPKKDIDRVFIHCLIKTERFSDFFLSLVTGSTGSRQRVPPKDTLIYKLALPKDRRIINHLCDIIGPLYKKRGLNITQQGTLSETRDSLLPKLMSGKIRVPNDNTWRVE